MRMTACFLVLSAWLAVAVGSASGTPASALESSAGADTCVFNRAGRKIGCLQDAYSCSLLEDSTRGQWLFMTQVFAPKEIETPKPDVAAKRVRPGVWEHPALERPASPRAGRRDEH